MHLNEYQQNALKTALLTALNLDYLLPGLVAEVGECFGKVAKAVRDEWPEEALQGELIKEWGDVAWFVSVTLHHVGVTEEAEGHYCYTYRISALDDAMTTAISALGYPCEPDLIGREVEEIWATLRDGSEVVTGSPFDEVLALNVHKLASRQERGVLGGSGDTR